MMEDLIGEVKFLNELVSEHEAEIYELETILQEKDAEICEKNLAISRFKRSSDSHKKLEETNINQHEHEVFEIPPLGNMASIKNFSGEESERSSLNRSRDFLYENFSPFTPREMES